ncbi:MAG: pilin [Candidatus Komeilibacteria bacterium]|nr:pilin [Candidatus Komeilibacteria bacterium]
MKFSSVLKKSLIVFIFVYLLLGFLPLAGLAQSLTPDVNGCCVCTMALTMKLTCERYVTKSECESKSSSIYVGEGKSNDRICVIGSCYYKECPQIKRTEAKPNPLPALKTFTPNVPIPGFTNMGIDNGLLARYIQALYKFFVGIAGILAVIMIAFGGLQWLFSGGSSDKISKAKETIIGAVMGLILALGSYLILYTINPNLTSFKPLDVKPLGQAQVSNFCALDASVVDDTGQITLGKYLKCGQKAKLSSNNDPCLGSGCPDENNGAVCYYNQGMNEAACLKCGDVDDGKLSLYNIPKTDDGCAIFNPTVQSTNHIQLCEYSTKNGGCFLADVDCNNSTSCSYYNDVENGAGLSLKEALAGVIIGSIIPSGGMIYGLTVDQSDAVMHLNRICTQNIQGSYSRTGICDIPGLSEFRACYMEGGSCSDRPYNYTGGGQAEILAGWSYDFGIEAQKDDASPDLIVLLNCLRASLNRSEATAGHKIGRISSISNENHIGHLDVCQAAAGRPADCHHGVNSCHYGGTSGDGKSHAVDIGDETNSLYINLAITSCIGYIGYHGLENNAPPDQGQHFHISSASCQQNN